MLFAAPRLRAQTPPRVGDERVILRTSAGDIVLEFYPGVAPRHVAQILNLVRMGAYDTAHFLRVIPGFIVQVADVSDRAVPLSERQAAAIHPLKAEFSMLHHERGVLSMSRDDADPDSARSSFSILLGDWKEGDGRYTIFGRVQEGMDVVDEFLDVPRDGDDQPVKRLEIISAEVVTPAQLAKRSLAAARPVEATQEEEAADAQSLAAERSKVLTAGLIVMVLMGLASYACAVRLHRAAPTVNLINVLIGVFVLFAALTPDAYLHPVLAFAVFFGLLATFRLMSQFESAA